MLVKIVNYLLMGAVGVLFGLLLSFPSSQDVPYEDPKIISIEKEAKDSVVVTVSFEKKFNECTFAALRVNGLVNGGYFKDLAWEDVDGDKGDRLSGGHTIRLRIFLVEGVEFVQVITRHYCGDKKVDLVLFEKNLLPIREGTDGT